MDKNSTSIGLTFRLALVIIGIAVISMAIGLLVVYLWIYGAADVSPAFSFASGTRLEIMLLAGLSVIGLLAVATYYASYRFMRPIHRLRDAASQIAGGDLSQALDIRSGDEVSEIAGHIDELRRELRHLIKTSSMIGRDLEQMVEERTRELEHALAEKDRIMDQLIQAEKLAAIGTMASGIGHEINNPLYAILGSAETIRDATSIQQCHEETRIIIDHCKDIAKIVQDLSGYIRPASDHELEQIDLGEKISDALSMAKRSILSDNVEIIYDFSFVPAIRAKSEEIKQVFFNIIRNSMQAIQGTGVLEISTGHEENRIWVKIRDTGPGIPKETLSRIFDPFYTTKGPDEGEGLGLYIVNQIVKKYEGTINVASDSGVGTTFTIQFPAAIDSCGDARE